MVKVTDFASELTERYGLKEDEAYDFVTAMFDIVSEQLDASDKQVKIKGLGTFKVTSVGARASVDVNTGERIIIEGRNKISFAPEVMLRDRVNRPFVQFETVVLNDGVDFSGIDDERDESAALAADSDDSVADVAVSETPVVADNVLPFAESTIAGGDVADDVYGGKADSDVDNAANAATSVQPAVDNGDSERTYVGLAVNDAKDRRDALPETEAIDAAPAGESEPVLDIEEPGKESGVVAHATQPSGEGESVSPATSAAECASGDKAEICKQRSPRLMYWLSAASFVLLLCIGTGMYMLYEQVKAKNQAIERLQDRLTAHTVALKTPAGIVHPKKAVQPAAASGLQAQPASAVDTLAKGSGKAGAEQKSIKPSAETASNKPSPTSDYNFDARVRTGAYIIVGVDKTVTVKPGQTLASISKAYLGPGMECYVEVFNNCTDAKPGDKLRIPKLKIKPRH